MVYDTHAGKARQEAHPLGAPTSFACWSGGSFAYITDHDGTDPAHGVVCVPTSTVVDVARLTYYAVRLLSFLRGLPPPVPPP